MSTSFIDFPSIPLSFSDRYLLRKINRKDNTIGSIYNQKFERLSDYGLIKQDCSEESSDIGDPIYLNTCSTTNTGREYIIYLNHEILKHWVPVILADILASVAIIISIIALMQ